MTQLWIYCCTVLTCAGWLLSALHSLNGVGYAVTLGVAAICGWLLRKKLGFEFQLNKMTVRLRRWRRRLFPMAFLTLASLIILGGIIHPPVNYDGLAYRVPRVLHWLAEGQWHWIHTDFGRLNTRATGTEWVSAPMLLFTGSVRPLVLIGIVSFLLLPGLVFSVLRQLGVGGRAAWHWMWLAPTGYCFVTQAGGIGNDLFGATLALASWSWALRASKTKALRDVAWAILGIALMTGAKPSNIPLALPGLLALWPARVVIGRHPLALATLLLVAALSSFLPMALLNQYHCGDWTGAKAEGSWLAKGDPRVTLPGNAVLLFTQNFVPPVFPMAKKWNEIAPKLWPGNFHQKMKSNFEDMGADMMLPDMQNEEAAGFGLGLCSLLLFSLAATIFNRSPAPNSVSEKNKWNQFIRLSPLASGFVYFWKATLGTTGRIFSPYYLFFLPLLLNSHQHNQLTRRRWWRGLALAVFSVAALLVVITPSRPLWPAKTIVSKLLESRPNNALLNRALTVYTIYGQRAEGLAPVRAQLPADATKVGFVTFDDLETTLWYPFGQRSFVHITREDTRADVDRMGLHYAILNGEWFPTLTRLEVSEWLKKFDATIVTQMPLRTRAARQEFTWYIVRFN